MTFLCLYFLNYFIYDSYCHRGSASSLMGAITFKQTFVLGLHFYHCVKLNFCRNEVFLYGQHNNSISNTHDNVKDRYD